MTRKKENEILIEMSADITARRKRNPDGTFRKKGSLTLKQQQERDRLFHSTPAWDAAIAKAEAGL